MPKVRVEINVAGFNEFRKQPALQADLLARGERIARKAGGSPDFETRVYPDMRTRARVTVGTATTQGRIKEAAHRSLTRAIDAGRG